MDDLVAAAPGNIAAIVTEGGTLATLAATTWDLPVTSCPGWSVADVVGHTAGVHRRIEILLRTGERARRDEVPTAPGDQASGLAWYEQGLDALANTADTLDPAEPRWTFAKAGPDIVGWWLRRMAQETAMHRWDVESASSAPAAPRSFLVPFALAGVDEYLDDFFPDLAVTLPQEGTLHLHATDLVPGGSGEWTVDLGDPAVPVRRDHGKADTALRGSASDLLLWLWNRQPARGHLEVFGDERLLDAWAAVRI